MLRFALLVDGADRLRGIAECGILLIDDKLGEDGRHLSLRRQGIPEFLLNQVAQHAFRFRAQDIEWLLAASGTCSTLKREEANLRPVAVRDEDLVAVGAEWRQRLYGAPDVGPLIGLSQPLTAFEKRIASECYDDAHGLRTLWSRRGPP